MLLSSEDRTTAGRAFESRSICTDQAVTRPGTFIQPIRPNHRAARIVRTDLRQNPRKRPSLTGQVGTVTDMATKKQTPNGLTEKDVLDWFQWTNHTKERRRLSKLWQYYALQPGDVWALIEQQEGYCPICGRLLILEAGVGVGIAIDHEGKLRQGHVRGVLHLHCNRQMLGVLERAYRDPHSHPEKNIARGYLSNPPAKKIKVGNSTLYDDKIEDRWKRGRPGRICEKPDCEKEIPSSAHLNEKYCDSRCRKDAANERKRAARAARKRKN